MYATPSGINFPVSTAEELEQNNFPYSQPWITSDLSCSPQASNKVAAGLINPVGKNHILNPPPGTNAYFTSNPSSSLTVESFFYEIVSQQFQRSGQYIARKLENLEWEADDNNIDIINAISTAIDLIGEPAIAALHVKIHEHKKHLFTLKNILNALSQAKDKSTEMYRIDLIKRLLSSNEPSVRYIATEALGNMASHSSDAKLEIKKVVENEKNPDVAEAARAYLR
jgi:hypothetical protein